LDRHISGDADNAAYQRRAPSYHCEEWPWGKPISAAAAKRRADRCNVIDVQRAAALEAADCLRRMLKARDVDEMLTD